MINRFLNYFVSCFGFECTTDFSNSIVHTKLLALTLPIAGISSILEMVLGLHSFTMVSFVVLITLELITGLIASRVKNVPIESHKFGRFGLKILVWLLLLYVVNTAKMEYIMSEGNFSVLASGLFSWLHGTMFIYITMEYFISVLENTAVITGKKNKTLIKIITDKLTSFFNNEREDKK